MKDGRRLTSLPLIPVVVSVFGQLNDTAVEYFEAVEKVAAKRGRRFRPELGGPRSLAELLSLSVIMCTASICTHAFSHRKGEVEVDVPDVVVPEKAGAGTPLEAGSGVQCCTVCGRFRVAPDFPRTCFRCNRGNSSHKGHDKVQGSPGKAPYAPTCALGRCDASCPGWMPVR